MKRDCIICKKDRQGRGMYRFTYLNEEVKLCGYCARKVMEYIKSFSDSTKEIIETKKQNSTEARSEGEIEWRIIGNMKKHSPGRS